jgi:hypothetical protein
MERPVIIRGSSFSSLLRFPPEPLKLPLESRHHTWIVGILFRQAYPKVEGNIRWFLTRFSGAQIWLRR